jgi:hypothetical protein
LEDMFGEKLYLEKVAEAYSKKVAGKTLALDPKTAGKKTLVERVEDAFTAQALGTFNKGRVAKRIVTDLSTKNLSSLDPTMADNFRKLIDAVNGVATELKKKS